MAKKKKTHGGRRKGAGRPPKARKQINPRFLFRVRADLFQRFEDAATARKITQRALMEEILERVFGNVSV